MLANFVGDNLGVNQIFGLIESFRGDYCCAICYATREEMQTKFKESEFYMRNREDYESDTARLDLETHVRGIKYLCPLNEVDNFHITENYSNDAMHTILQGVIPYVLGCLLHKISTSNKDFTVDIFNRKLSSILIV